MKLNILFESDNLNSSKVNDEYLKEYDVAKELGFNTILIESLNLKNGKIRVVTEGETGLCIYRGSALKPETYKSLQIYLESKRLMLVNSYKEYCNCYLFPYSYPLLEKYTPKIITYLNGAGIDWDYVKQNFGRFMIKDYAKSAKGSDFPKYLNSSISNAELDRYIVKFKALRGNSFVLGVVIKEFVDLAKEQGVTNEYRAFYVNGELLTVCCNSNQKEGVKKMPKSLIDKIPILESKFYTVDFAEKANGEFVVIETGDGQVSEIPDSKDIREFYNGLQKMLGV